MSLHTQRESQLGYPTFGIGRGKRPGLGFDAQENPQILDTTGAVRATWTSTVGSALTVRLPVTGLSSSAGVVAGLANPFGYTVLIVNRVLRVTTPSSAAATVDVGIAADAVTSADNLIDGQSVAATGMVSANGTNGGTYVAWNPGQFLNVSEASGDVAGLVGTVYLVCVKV